MIATLEGTVSEKFIDTIVVNVGGVGYGLLVPTNDYSSVSVGSSAKFYIHEHIKEDAHDLFAFRSVESKNLFEHLLNVKNVGPKVALAILDIGDVATVSSAIASGEVKFLQTAKGVGKRAAEQIVVELRDKLGVTTNTTSESVVSRAGINQQDEAIQALMSLGYSDIDAQQALSGVDKSLTTEERVTKALKRSQ